MRWPALPQVPSRHFLPLRTPTPSRPCLRFTLHFSATKPKHHAKIAARIRTAAEEIDGSHSLLHIQSGVSARDLIAMHRLMKRVSAILLFALSENSSVQLDRANRAKTPEVR